MKISMSTMKTISNEYLTVVIDPQGAEMQSLKHTASGREYLWQGDPAYWEGRSPILFPAVGGLWDGTYRYNGQTYPMPKHGFMRDKLWQVAEERSDSLTLTYEGPQEETDRQAFPWAFALTVCYALEGDRLVVTFTVSNKGSETMYFQMGGHPGFALPDFDEAADVDGFLKLEGDVKDVVRASEQGCVGPERFKIPLTEDGLVPLAVSTFENEALIFDGGQLKAATLFDKSRRPLLRVESCAPVWLFWSPQGVHSPFVCAEPWYGLCDSIGFDSEVSEHAYINSLVGGGKWHGGYSITLCAD